MHTLFDLKPRYRQHAANVLSYLARTVDGKALRKQLEIILRIPKSSMTEVLQRLERIGGIRAHKLYPVKESSVIEITYEGRQIFDQYSRAMIPAVRHGLPDHVMRYLNVRGITESMLFKVQRVFLERGLIDSNTSVAVFSPPATGKTLIAEMAIARELSRQGKTLYCTPYKALDWQKFKDFEKWFARLGGKVVVTDGDQRVSASQLSSANVVISTYERALGAVRYNEAWLSKVRLVCADEINILGGDRGAIVDLLLSQLVAKGLRILTLSSPMGNAPEISEWLKAEMVVAPSEDEIEEFVVYRDRDDIVLFSKNGRKEYFPSASEAVPFLVSRHLANQETTIIFVEARFIAEYVAEALKPLHMTKNNELVHWAETIKRSVGEITPLIERLCSLLPHGVAFHHAGLPREARRTIEHLLDERKLRTVVATTTLSHGVDYSIDNVIVSLIERGRRWEIDRYLYVNLRGRAGRPEKSKSGRAYIITETSDARKCWGDYFYGELERLYPTPATITKERIGALALSVIDEKRFGDAKEVRKHLIDLLQRTISIKPSQRRMTALVRQTIDNMKKFRFLEQKNNCLSRTTLGSLVNKLDLEPYEASTILDQINGMKTRSDLLKLAVSIDMAKFVRREIPKAPDTDPSSVLSTWTNGLPLAEITRSHRFWDDFDVEQLAKYGSIALGKIKILAAFVGLESLEKQAAELANQITKRFSTRHSV